jgi:hypothetical protein
LFIKLEDKGIELITPNFLIEQFLKRRKELANALGISETFNALKVPFKSIREKEFTSVEKVLNRYKNYNFN